MLWPTVKRLFQKKPAGQAYQHMEAYQKTFLGTPEGKMVLADLAAHTGFYSSTHPQTSPEARAYQDGMRNVYSRILSIVRMTEEEKRALEEAFFEEASDK